MALEIGSPAPDFRSSDHRGQNHRLNDYAGKTLVLWFYPKADTPGWTIEGCGFRDIKTDLESKDAAVLGVSFDTLEENKAFAEKFDFNFPLLCDTNRAMGLAYGACDDASSACANRIGVVIGSDGNIQEYHSNVDAENFPGEVYSRI